jgi:hypothetical protein
MTHYNITKVGAEINNRFLEKRMTGTHWTSSHFAHKFLSLESAQKEASKHENVRILWVDPTDPCGWGEVHEDFQSTK